MANWRKILEDARTNPRNVRLSDACKLAEIFGFSGRAGGKHPHVYKRRGFSQILNFQEGESGRAKTYQVKQLLAAIEELGGEPPENPTDV